jgi:hypothetical protein
MVQIQLLLGLLLLVVVGEQVLKVVTILHILLVMVVLVAVALRMQVQTLPLGRVLLGKVMLAEPQRLLLIAALAVAVLAVLAVHQAVAAVLAVRGQVHFLLGPQQQVQVLQGLTLVAVAAVMMMSVVQVVLAVAVMAWGKTIQANQVVKVLRVLAQQILVAAAVEVGTTLLVHPVMVAPVSSLFVTKFKEKLNGTFCKSC